MKIFTIFSITYAVIAIILYATQQLVEHGNK